MNELQNIANQIILLGKQNDWFIPMDLVSESDFIYVKGNIVIVDTSGITFFIGANKDELPELEEQLREMIEVEVPDSNGHTVLIELKDSYI